MKEPKVIAVVGAEPLSLADAQLHLRVDGTADDAFITALLPAAREHCENFLGLSLTTKTLEIALDEWPDDDEDDAIELPMGPVQAIVSVTAAGSALTADTWLLDDYRMAARLLPASSWPGVTAAPNTIKVRYTAGFDSAALPAPVRAAMLLVLGHLFEHREEATERGLASLPLGVEALLRPYRVRIGMA